MIPPRNCKYKKHLMNILIVYTLLPPDDDVGLCSALDIDLYVF